MNNVRQESLYASRCHSTVSKDDNGDVCSSFSLSRFFVCTQQILLSKSLMG
jgi:hypothetical protein